MTSPRDVELPASSPPDSEPGPAPSDPGGASSRRRILAAVVGFSVLTAAAGFVAGSRLTSTAEAERQAAPPPASLITVPIESRTLESNVVARGDIRFAESTEVTVALGADSSGLVTTAPPPVDDLIDEGATLLEIGGRPVFLLGGDLPSFRDVRPGQTGDDVEQIQAGLSRLGFYSGPVDGVYGTETQEAVAAFYTNAGHTAPGATQDELDRLRAARDAVDAARSEVRSAESALDDVGTSVSRSTRLQLDADLASARDAVEDAKADLAATVAIAEAERVAAVAARDAAAAEIPPAETVVADAIAALDAATGGVDPVTSEPFTEEQLAGLRNAVATAEADLAGLRSALAAAEVAVSEATENVAAVRNQGEDAVRQAETGLAITEASRAEQLAPPDTAAASSAVADARERLARAQEDLAELEGEIGTVFPQSELVFLDELPRRVETSVLERGDLVSGAVMRVSGAELIIDSAVSAADRPLLSEGMALRIEDADLGIEAAGEISFLASSAGTGGAASNRFEMRVVALDDLPAEARGLNVRLTIPVSSTGGEVLAVPLAALSAGADGSSRVEVAATDGTTRLVGVRVGLSAGGFAEIEARDGSLTAGDRVVVGTEGTDGADGGGDESASRDLLNSGSP